MVVDADAVTHEVLEQANIKTALVDSFGIEILSDNGYIDRVALGEKVFGNVQQRELLESILRSTLEAELWRRIERFKSAVMQRRDVSRGVVILDAPLIVEWAMQDRLQRLIVVVADEALKVVRLKNSRGLSGEEIKKRIQAQVSDNERTAAADMIVDNNAGLLQLEQIADDLWTELTRRMSSS